MQGRKTAINDSTVHAGQRHPSPSCARIARRTCVGVVVVRSSFDSRFRIVVLPALSSPSTRMRACCEGRGACVQRGCVRALLVDAALVGRQPAAERSSYLGTLADASP